jgi:hypothetical protein
LIGSLFLQSLIKKHKSIQFKKISIQHVRCDQNEESFIKQSLNLQSYGKYSTLVSIHSFVHKFINLEIIKLMAANYWMLDGIEIWNPPFLFFTINMSLFFHNISSSIHVEPLWNISRYHASQSQSFQVRVSYSLIL